MYKRWLVEFQTQKESQQNDLDKIGLVISVVLMLFSSEIANYNTTVNEAWFVWKNINYFNYVIIFWALRKEVIKKIGKTGYKIVISLLINYFIDQYFELKGWSWNDFLTVILIGVEAVFATIKRIKNERR